MRVYIQRVRQGGKRKIRAEDHGANATGRDHKSAENKSLMTTARGVKFDVRRSGK